MDPEGCAMQNGGEDKSARVACNGNEMKFQYTIGMLGLPGRKWCVTK